MKRARLLLGCLLLGLSGVSCTSDGPTEAVVNRCNAALGCASGDSCDAELGLCVRERAERPYDFVVQVVTNSAGLVERTWGGRRTLVEAPTLSPIAIRNAVRFQGSVIAPDQTTQLQAEVAFFPRRDPAFLSTALSAFTHIASGKHVFTASLDPATTYDVRVFPLGSDSRRYPPNSFIIETTNVDQSQDLAYPQISPLRGRLAQETVLPPGSASRLAGLKVRLRQKSDLAFVSSVTELTPTGDYELFVTPDVLERLFEHELVIDLLRAGQPWVATLAVDGARLANRTITIPDIPELVSVAVVLTAQGGLMPSADFTFVSDFLTPPPNEAIQPERDWCRLRAASNITFKCSVRITTPVDGSTGKKTVALLPGYYRIFIAPNADIQSADRVATAVEEESVLPQPGGLEQGPVSYELSGPALYTGRVISPLGKAMPLVTVTANALNIIDEGNSDELRREVAAYNRSAQAVSKASGQYALAVDPGSYDLIAAAPEGTGFPWYCSPNRQLTESESVSVRMDSPVVAQGSVVDEQGKPVYAARIEAFAIVEDQAGGRAVRIARTESSDAGTFTLLLPTKIEHDPVPVGGVDGGLALGDGLDAGVASP